MTADNPETPTPRVGRGNTSRGVRRELWRVYVDARQGRLAPGHAAKLAYVLTCLHRVIEIEDVEARLDALERVAAERGQ